jgi:hypothetical protein
MENIEIYEALKKIAHSNHPDFTNWEIPVTIGDERGKVPLLQIFDILVAHGGLAPDTQIGVEFVDDDGDYIDGYHPLKDLESTGPVISI